MRRERKMSRKGDVTLMFLVLVIAVVMAVVLIGGLVANYFGFVYQIINIKGKINIYMVNDDAGTELVSLLNAKTTSMNHMELLGWYNTEGIAEEKIQYINPVMTTMNVSFANYDFSFTGPRPVSFQKGVPSAIQDSKKSAIACGITTAGNLTLRWPSSSKSITSGFGGRELNKGQCDCHGGIDIGGEDENVYAAAGGIVVDVYKGCTVGDLKCNHGYGNYVVVEHKVGLNTYRTYYDHLKQGQVYVSVNDEVGYETSQPKAIAKSGNTGYSTGAHLHFELRKYPYAPDRDSISTCGTFKDTSGVTGNCIHEQVSVCKYVSGMLSSTTVSSYQADVPLPGAKSGTARGTVVFKQWD